MTDSLADDLARSLALDPTGSFIVQAPAGSGKTGLLTLRFLKLLTMVKQPEEVVAITFTRKAAAEMKSRILEAFAAGSDEAPADDFKRQSWELAGAVLKRDQELMWGLTENPGRLRILTIDALCSNISRQMPVLSRLGGSPTIIKDPEPLFIQAARTTLDHMAGQGELAEATRFLLDHLDNNMARAESLLAAMLSRRDQWLRHVTGRRGAEIRKLLEHSLQTIVYAEIRHLTELAPEQFLPEIIQLTRQAANLLLAAGSGPGPLADWASMEQLPDEEIEALSAWKGIGELLLRADGNWRKSFNAKIGFPPQSQGKNSTEKTALKKHKARATALVDELNRHELFRQALHNTRTLPPTHYTEGQWAILSALLTLLPVCAAHLKLLFAQQRVVDYAEVSQSALNALGDSSQPTDLALKLDYRISHLLVDEFQDTSRTQYDLIERLIAGWDDEGGNTLFLVGDPMQSIYRFREAEVGLFLQARQVGIPPIKLTPLTLTVNFRSEAGIVNWVNNAMADIFPVKEQISVGAVPYNDSVPFHPIGDIEAVKIHPMPPKDYLAEAGQVAAITDNARKQGLSVAVLVRSRNHLAKILPAFDAAGLRYQAVEVHKLIEQPMIQDLLALTRALSHPADRIAWFATLHAPWCGLSLADLHGLANESDPRKTTLWQQVMAEDVIQRLSTDGQSRILRFRQVMTATLENRGRGDHFPGQGGWRRWVEGCWLALGGPATLSGDAQLADARTFFDLLEAAEQGGGVLNFSVLNENIEKLYGATDPHADPDLVVMTLHKAKGLEFDVVILPGLDRRPRGEERRLLTWLDGSLDEPSASLPLLAPIGRSDQEAEDSIQGYIRSINKQKSAFETTRLLYVAVTRAKKQLHLLGGTVEEEKKPPSNSFLATLWPALNEPFTSTTNEQEEEKGEPGGAELIVTPIKSLGADWQLPTLPAMVKQIASTSETDPAQEPVLFDWAGDSARLVGLVVHRYLSRMADEGVERWSAQKVEDQHPAISAHLVHLAIPSNELDETIDRVKSSLNKTLLDERGRWILDATHSQSRSELAMSGFLDGRKIRAIIDRSFVDSEDNRWIIDFKTSIHSGGGLEGFLDNERIRYQDQLNRYAMIFDKTENHSIRLGLYFPILSGWREWSYGEKF
jgi:ATP-dependent helicase/nuclease subunit A